MGKARKKLNQHYRQYTAYSLHSQCIQSGYKHGQVKKPSLHCAVLYNKGATKS